MHRLTPTESRRVTPALFGVEVCPIGHLGKIRTYNLRVVPVCSSVDSSALKDTYPLPAWRPSDT